MGKMKIRDRIICEIDRFIDKVNSILSGMVSPSSYKCPICGKESKDHSEIYTDLYGHIYNKDKKDNKDNK